MPVYPSTYPWEDRDPLKAEFERFLIEKLDWDEKVAKLLTFALDYIASVHGIDVFWLDEEAFETTGMGNYDDGDLQFRYELYIKWSLPTNPPSNTEELKEWLAKPETMTVDGFKLSDIQKYAEEECGKASELEEKVEKDESLEDEYTKHLINCNYFSALERILCMDCLPSIIDQILDAIDLAEKEFRETGGE